jgi:long-chain fatty acid transport protein
MASGAANAGGFAIREQSAIGQGASFAGVAAGGTLSSMFWNPATMTQVEGKGFSSNATLIIPHASHSYTASTLAGLSSVYAGTTSNSSDSAVVPASYSSWQLNDRFWLGLSVNAPFGLGVSFSRFHAAAAYAQTSSIQSYNFQPAIAYKINDMVSVALGAQVQYMRVSYNQLQNAGTGAVGILGGQGMAYGFTAGVTVTPMVGTTIGIGYRSALDQKIDGTLQQSGAPTSGVTSVGSVNTTINLPDSVTVGLRQRVGDRFTLLAGFEWANWSRIGTSTVSSPTGIATIGGSAVRLPFQYSDGYYYSIGGEYAWRPDLTLRAGIGYEVSPVTDSVRTPRLPDNDRMWYSVGASYTPTNLRGLTFDLGYSFIDVKNTPINLGPTTGNPWSGAGSTVYTGSVESNIHILSVGIRYQWDAPAKTKQAYAK